MATDAICARPAKTGRNAGQPATGTPGGYARHYRAGEPACSACLAAHNAQSLAWVEANPEKRSEIERRWYEKHREQALTCALRFREANPHYQKQWYKDNRERKQAVSREWVRANRDQVLEYQRQWRKDNPDLVAETYRRWRQGNPEKVAEFARRRRARVHAASIVPFTAEQLNQRMAYWGFKCWMCSGPFEAVDHVKPLAKGGPHVLANLRPACNPCNRRKSARWDGVEGLAS